MERNNKDTPVLVGQSGPLNGQRWLLRDSIVIGRDMDCDISIPNRQVSRKHARLTMSGPSVHIEDMGSRNGTHLNGSILVESKILKDGDVIHIAFAQQFMYLSSDATLPLEMGPILDVSASHEGLLRLDKSSRQVWIREEEIIPPLSASQFQLLEILYERQDRVVPRKEIISEIWGAENAVEVSEQALDALVRRLRERLASIDPTYPYIITVRGHGLRLDNPRT
jgi:hypothetical protein